MSVIVQRIINSAVDQRYLLKNSYLARPFNVGTWTQIRIGIRFSMADLGANILCGPVFALGISSSSGGPYGTFNWRNLYHVRLGYIDASSYWLRSASGYYAPPAQVIGFAYNPVSSTSVILPSSTSFVGYSNTGAVRNILVAEFTRSAGVTNTISALAPYNTTSGDISKSTFLDVMEQTLMANTNCALRGPSTLVTDEATYGTFDTVNVYWGRSTPTIEICDLAIARTA